MSAGEPKVVAWRSHDPFSDEINFGCYIEEAPDECCHPIYDWRLIIWDDHPMFSTIIGTDTLKELVFMLLREHLVEHHDMSWTAAYARAFRALQLMGAWPTMLQPRGGGLK